MERLREISLLEQLSAQRKEIELPGKGVVFNFFNPEGIEMRHFLDEDHLPQVTRFDTVILSPAFADLRGESPLNGSPAKELRGTRSWLMAISQIAADMESYDPDRGWEKRLRYTKTLVEAAGVLFRHEPLKEDEVVVPIVRGGANIARRLGIQGVEVEVKRLRFTVSPDLLGAGVNFSSKVRERLTGGRIRLFEGVIASGSTESAFMASLSNWEIPVAAVDADAVFVAPAGARFCAELRRALGIAGEDRAVFLGGVLDRNWYVRYHPQDPLRSYLGREADRFIGQQVLGDAGDLTTI